MFSSMLKYLLYGIVLLSFIAIPLMLSVYKEETVLVLTGENEFNASFLNNAQKRFLVVFFANSSEENTSIRLTELAHLQSMLIQQSEQRAPQTVFVDLNKSTKALDVDMYAKKFSQSFLTSQIASVDLNTQAALTKGFDSISVDKNGVIPANTAYLLERTQKGFVVRRIFQKPPLDHREVFDTIVHFGYSK